MGDRLTMRRSWGRPLTGKPRSTAKSRKRGPFDFYCNFGLRDNTVDYVDRRLPAFAFTIASGWD